MLKVLHLHDSDLDDPRIINAAVTGQRAEYEPYFCGVMSGDTLVDGVFKGYKWIKFSDLARVASRFIPGIEHIWRRYPYPRSHIYLERQIKSVIDDIRPDIIHAHNIFAAHYASLFDVPVVFDDHECYSKFAKAKHEYDTTLRGRAISKLKQTRWSKWEREVSEHSPVITVSPGIAEYYKTLASDVFVVPNYPMSTDIVLDQLRYSADNPTLNSVYLGTDSTFNPSTIRNISGLHETFDTCTGRLLRIGVKSPNTSFIRSFGNIPMSDAYSYMQDAGHIGLIPWKQHWFHPLCSPNKSYEYAHCGLHLIITDDLTFVIDEFRGLCDIIHNYDELHERLAYYNSHRDELDSKRLATLNYAKKHFIWETQESKILEAYKKV